MAFARSLDVDPSLALSERFRHDGTTYTWAELAYGPDRQAFATLEHSIRTQFNTGRAYFVEGIADDRVSLIAGGGRLQLHLYSDLDPDAPQMRVFMPATPPFRDRVNDIHRGTRVAVFSQASLVLDRVDGVALSLVNPDQLHYSHLAPPPTS